MNADRGRRQCPDPAEQSGYALVALLAVMTLLSLFALAAAPSMRQQLQRQREREAIFRGEQVAAAIRVCTDLYRLARSKPCPMRTIRPGTGTRSSATRPAQGSAR